MRNSFMIVFALLVSTFFLFCSKSNTADINMEGRLEIETMNVEFEAAYKNGDAEGVASMATEDAILSPIGLQDLKGRDAVRSLLSGVFEANAVVSYELVIAELEVYGNTVYDRGTYLWISRHDGKTEMRVHGRYSAVRKKGADNKWRFHRLIENALP